MTEPRWAIGNGLKVTTNEDYSVGHEDTIEANYTEWATPVSIADLPDDIDSIYGIGDVADASVIGFWLVNDGSSLDGVEFASWEIRIINVDPEILPCIRILVWCDGYANIYALDGEVTGIYSLPNLPFYDQMEYPEIRYLDVGMGYEITPEPFLDDIVAASGSVDSFYEGEARKFTIAVWVETGSSSMSNDILGKSIELGFFVSANDGAFMNMVTNIGLSISPDVATTIAPYENGYPGDFDSSMDASGLSFEECPLRPVTYSKDNISFAEYIDDFQGYSPVVMPNVVNILDDGNCNIHEGETPGENKYVAIPIFIRTAQICDVCLSPPIHLDDSMGGNGSFVMGESSENGTSWAAQSVRVGFRVTEVDEMCRPFGEPKFIVWEPNFDSHHNGSDGYIETPSIDGGVYNENIILQTTTTEYETGFFGNDAKIGRINHVGNMLYVVIYFWLEANDVDCVPYEHLDATHLLSNIQFTTSKIQTGTNDDLIERYVFNNVNPEIFNILLTVKPFVTSILKYNGRNSNDMDVLDAPVHNVIYDGNDVREIVLNGKSVWKKTF